MSSSPTKRLKCDHASKWEEMCEQDKTCGIKNPLILAVREGCKWDVTTLDPSQYKHVISFLIRKRLKVINQRGEIFEECLTWTAAHGLKEFMMWLMEHPLNDSTNQQYMIDCLKGAILANNIQMVDFILNLEPINGTHELYELAAEKGHWEILEKLMTALPIFWNKAEILNTAVHKGHIHIVDKLLKTKICPTDTNTWKKGIDKIDMLKLFVETYCIRTTSSQRSVIMRTAIRFRQVESFIYLHTQGFELSQSLMQSACVTGYVPIMQYLFDHGFQPHKHSITEFLPCVKRDHITGVKWLIDHGCELSYSVLEDAIKYGTLELVQLLHSHQCPWFPHVCEIAAQVGKVDILRWNHDTICRSSEREYFKSDDINSSLDGTGDSERRPDETGDSERRPCSPCSLTSTNYTDIEAWATIEGNPKLLYWLMSNYNWECKTEDGKHLIETYNQMFFQLLPVADDLIGLIKKYL